MIMQYELIVLVFIVVLLLNRLLRTVLGSKYGWSCVREVPFGLILKYILVGTCFGEIFLVSLCFSLSVEKSGEMA